MIRGASKFFMSLSPTFLLLSPRSISLRLSRQSRVSLAYLSAAQNRRFAANSRSRLGFSIRASEQIHTQVDSREDCAQPNGEFSTNSRVSHPWPEWSKLVENLRGGGYFDREMPVVSLDDDDGFSVFEELPEEFVRAANACLSFARDRSDLLSSLSKKDIEVVVESGSAFLFKNGMNSTRRLRSFIGSNGSDVLEFERARTVDVMRFLLSYTYNSLGASDQTNVNNGELREKSVRNLLKELAHMSGTVRESGFSEPMPRQFPDRNGQSPRPFGQNIEMKRGDWICPKCSFMNFARNMKCLECHEARPKRQLTGGEWECPQCNFFNYGKNAVCLRCDCNRPGGTPFGAAGPGSGSFYGKTFNGSNSNKSDIESRLASNEEKAERWFNKVSQLDNISDMSSAIADEDFPEIMPLRKGVNRFVVSTRKTPIERRLENAQYRRNLGNNGSPGVENDFQTENVGGIASDKTSETSISQSLDRILGRSSAVPETDNSVSEKTDNRSGTGTEQRVTSSQYRQNLGNQRSDSGYVPFVPLPADMFGKPRNSSTEEKVTDSNYSVSTKAGEHSPGSVSRGHIPGTSSDGFLTPKPESSTESDRAKEQAEKSERWFKKVAELHDVSDLSSAISDEDFPEIMPMRKGENRFVVSKKKDRSLTSPQYKRRLAMEQSNSSNFVPFVPFPPDYFAKKDKQPEAGVPTEKAASETSAPEKLPATPERPGDSSLGTVRSSASNSDNQQTNKDQWSAGFPENSLNESKVGAVGNSTQRPDNLRTNAGEGWNSGFSVKDHRGVSSTQQSENMQNQFTGKSLEGSLVKEPDPLDMSEEAKAERWFRRVAQIKDISELSQIPDEDFPTIMPMRKGVNRFVVSKRKTPLERRLTSPQYRRNLPIMNSDPTEKKDTSS